MDNKFYVYLHIKETNGSPFYVGKGFGKRAFSKNRSSYWRNTVNKYGYDIIFLEENITNEEALRLEQYWIKRIGRKDLQTGILVNHTDGGEGSINPSKELRFKIGNGMRGKKHSVEWIENTKTRMFGNKYSKNYIHTEEHKRNMSKSLKDRVFSEQHKQKISNSHLGKIKSKTHCENISKTSKGKKVSQEVVNRLVKCHKGKIWVNNTKDKCKRIDESNLALFINNGWVKGFLRFNKK